MPDSSTPKHSEAAETNRPRLSLRLAKSKEPPLADSGPPTAPVVQGQPVQVEASVAKPKPKLAFKAHATEEKTAADADRVEETAEEEKLVKTVRRPAIAPLMTPKAATHASAPEGPGNTGGTDDLARLAEPQEEKAAEPAAAKGRSRTLLWVIAGLLFIGASYAGFHYFLNLLLAPTADGAPTGESAPPAVAAAPEIKPTAAPVAIDPEPAPAGDATAPQALAGLDETAFLEVPGGFPATADAFVQRLRGEDIILVPAPAGILIGGLFFPVGSTLDPTHGIRLLDASATGITLGDGVRQWELPAQGADPGNP